ncbi:hypothetical protein AB0F30_17100 [Streptomyces sp. NPDC029006]|uniref:hypothetical protein n=1 Tax=Streptomyces sp. NPDC029006 TaxID=3155467 RepID=UPI0034099636
MPQNSDFSSIERALDSVRTAAVQYRTSKGSATRSALNEAIVLAVRAGAKQARVAEASGLSKAQVSRVARGGSSGRSVLPPAERLLDTLPADEVIRRYRAGETTAQLGQAYGCSRSTIIDVLKRHNVPRRVDRTIQLPVSNEELARRYLHERAEIQQLAAECGVTPNLISRRLAAAGVAVPVGHRRMDLPDAEIVRRYRQGESLVRLARAFGVSLPTIKRRIREDDARARAGGVG